MDIKMKNIATVAGYNNTRYKYINRYYDAGYELVNIAINEKNGSYKKDTLFYPICCSYRHYDLPPKKQYQFQS